MTLFGNCVNLSDCYNADWSLGYQWLLDSVGTVHITVFEKQWVATHRPLLPKTLPRSSPCCLGLSPLRGLLCVNHAIFCGTVTLASEIHRESTLALGHFHKTHDNTIGIVICFCYFAHCNFFVVLHKPTQHTFKVKSFYWVVHASAGQWKGSASFSGLLHSFTRNDFSHSVSYIYLKGEWSCPDLFQWKTFWMHSAVCTVPSMLAR